MKLVDTIGVLGPCILFFLTILLLHKKYTFFSLIYVIGFVLNILLNFFLKLTIREPRPIGNKSVFGKGISKNYIDKFGMPSGHAQEVFYSTVFIYFVLQNWKITLFYLAISLVTIYQRWKYKNHTINQLIVGGMVGSLMGYLMQLRKPTV